MFFGSRVLKELHSSGLIPSHTVCLFHYGFAISVVQSSSQCDMACGSCGRYWCCCYLCQFPQGISASSIRAAFDISAISSVWTSLWHAPLWITLLHKTTVGYTLQNVHYIKTNKGYLVEKGLVMTYTLSKSQERSSTLYPHLNWFKKWTIIQEPSHSIPSLFFSCTGLLPPVTRQCTMFLRIWKAKAPPDSDRRR